MRWLARFSFFAICLCLLSCSASSVLFLHNDTGEPFEYKISATFKHEREPTSERGTLNAHEAKEGLSYFAREAEQVDLEILQKGKTRTQTFREKDLPVSLTYASSGGMWSNIKVSDREIVIDDGSGNWGADFQHRYWIFFPCGGFMLFIGFVVLAVRLSSRAKRRRQGKG